jgi:hypothetical protein
MIKKSRFFIRAKTFEGKYHHHFFPDPFLRKHFAL